MKTILIVFCVLNGLAGAQQPNSSPPPTGVPSDAKLFNGHWYKVFFEQLDWNQAKQECERKNGQLAITPDSATWNYVKKLTGKAVWLGASNDNLSGEWRWVDGNVMRFTAWADGQPNNTEGKQHYLATTESESWQDRAMEWSESKQWPIRGYICQWKDPNQIATYSVPITPPGIPPDSKVFNGQGWKVFFEQVNWDQAKQRCEQMGGQLAVIPDAPTWGFVKSLTRKTVWLGASDEDHEGTWKWIDGTPMSFTAWDDGEPGNKDRKEHYLCRGSQNGWADTVKRWDGYRHWPVEGFICQWKFPPTKTASANAAVLLIAGWDAKTGAIQIKSQNQLKTLRVTPTTVVRLNGLPSKSDILSPGLRVLSYTLLPNDSTALSDVNLVK